MARKMKTMDGNQAAAHASYAYHRSCTDLPDHTIICNARTRRRMGNRRQRRTSSDRLYR